jgi:hypothetical protein
VVVKDYVGVHVRLCELPCVYVCARAPACGWMCLSCKRATPHITVHMRTQASRTRGSPSLPLQLAPAMHPHPLPLALKPLNNNVPLPKIRLIMLPCGPR